MTATYEEVVVIAQSAEPPEDAEVQQDPRYATSSDLDADADAVADAGRRDSQLRDRGRDRDRDHEHDQSYTPAHLRPPFEPEGTRDEQDAALSIDGDHEAPDITPRGDVRGDVGPLIDDLKALFQRDRSTASTTGGTRCGICYLHFALDALEYREDEGYYVCAVCAQALGAARVPMVRRQKRA